MNTARWTADLVGGVTLFALAVPLNIGYAQIAGLPPTAGLAALIVPAIAYAIPAFRQQLVAGPDAAAAALIASSVGALAMAGSGTYVDLVLAQALIGGVAFGIARLARLGSLANFLSAPILTGFVSGLALEVLLSQVDKALGVSAEGEFFEKLLNTVIALPTTHLWSMLVALAAAGVVLVGRRLAAAVPWALVALVVTTVGSVLLDLEGRGVAVLGHVDPGVPLPHLPRLDVHQWLSVVPSALALTFVTMAEGLLLARRYAEKSGVPFDPDRVLTGFAVGNVGAGLFGGMTVGSSASRTAAVHQTGSRTQVPSLVTAGLTVVLLLVGTALLEPVPLAAIAAVVGLAVLPLVGIGEYAELARTRRSELVVALVCCVGTLVLGPIRGLLVALVLALLELARRASAPHLQTRTGSTPWVQGTGPDDRPGPVVLRFPAPLFFGNASTFVEAVQTLVRRPESTALILDAEGMSDVDFTGAAALRQTLAAADEAGVPVAYSRVRPDLRTTLETFELAEGRSFFDSNEEALDTLRAPVRPRPAPTAGSES